MQPARLGSPLLGVFLLVLAVAGHARTSPPASDLADTSWQLVKFEGGDDKILTPDDPAKHTVAFPSDGALSIRMADAGIYEFEPAPPEGRTTGHLMGSATYRERMALPDKAVLVVTLEDVSRAGAKSEVIAQVRVEHPRNPPIAFDIPYDPSRIHPNHRYTLRARIEVEGELLFTTDRHYPVLGADESGEISLLMKRVGTSPSSAAPADKPAKESATVALEDTEWTLTSLGGTPVQSASAQQQPSIVLESRSHRVSGSGGCNRITGGYELQGDHLIFNQMASTMMACVSGMDTEEVFLDALKQVRGWKITDNDLELVDATGHPLAQFQARPMK